MRHKPRMGLTNDVVVEAYERHKNMTAAAQELCCTRANIRWHLKRAGYSKRFKVVRPTSWSPAETAMVKNHYKQGLSASQIGEILGRSRNEVIGKAHRMGM